MKTTNQTTGDYSLLSLIRGDKLIIINPATENTVMKKIYLDVCCLNRPVDDQTQGRVRFCLIQRGCVLTKIMSKLVK